MQKLARSLPHQPALFSKRSTLLLLTSTGATTNGATAATTTGATTATYTSSTGAPSTITTSSTIRPPIDNAAILSERDLADLRNLLPSLCDAGHPLDAIRLLDAALLASPPLSSPPLQDLADRLCSLPDTSASMALLAALRIHPRRPSPLPFCATLLSSYFRLRRLREAAKVFAWLCRADSPCRPNMEIYQTTIRGFCEAGRALEAIRVAKEMVRDGVVPTVDLRVLLCHVLLREARVDEALDLDSAMKRVGEEDGCRNNGMNGISKLLDCMIKNWED